MNHRRIPRFVVSTVAAAACLATAGCFSAMLPESGKSKTDSKSEKKTTVAGDRRANRQPELPPANPAANQPQPPNPVPQFPRGNAVGKRQPPPTTLPVNRAPSSSQYIHLSTGTALPQTLPQEETLSFTAEYRFTGGPKSGVTYAFVVQGRGGKTARFKLPNLKRQGQLPGMFTRAFRSNDAPFRGFIEEWPASSGRRRPGDGKRVSNVIPLS